MFRSQTSRCVPRINNGHRLIPTSRVRYNTTVRLFSRSAVISQNVPFRIDGEGTSVAQTISVHGSPHRIRVDAYPSFGGNDSAPTPLAFSLSSLGSCTQVTGSLVARDLGIQLGKWNVTVKGDLPTVVLVRATKGIPTGTTSSWKCACKMCRTTRFRGLRRRQSGDVRSPSCSSAVGLGGRVIG
jgi:hypothetical protein